MTRIRSPRATSGRAPSHTPPDMTYAPGRKLSRGLGWFSIALGAAELLAPELMHRVTGVRSRWLLQVYGIREIANGVGILSCEKPAGWMWARVAGDAIDLAALGDAVRNGDSCDQRAAAISAGAVLGVLALDVAAATQLTLAKRADD